MLQYEITSLIFFLLTITQILIYKPGFEFLGCIGRLLCQKIKAHVFPETKTINMKINESFIVSFDEIPLLILWKKSGMLGGECDRVKKSGEQQTSLFDLPFSFQPGEHHLS